MLSTQAAGADTITAPATGNVCCSSMYGYAGRQHINQNWPPLHAMPCATPPLTWAPLHEFLC